MTASDAGASELHDAAGFTLLEMVVALLILALVATAALPALQTRSRAPSIDAISRELVARFQMTRTLAITRASEQRVSLVPAKNQVRFGDGSTIEIPQGVEMTVVTGKTTILAGQEAVLTFLPNGSTSGLDLYLRRDRERLRISVNWLSGLPSRSWDIE
ncbi:prepilin-type N-terminal cleavage/methylation domain-containing protein [Mesorhizobium sp. CC13]|uniref:GspH/FimT family pseudopilin n=1 Tax=Mesorhizobium sp. CC13 TaxID=3029194 RepID=UPI003265FC9E